MAVKYSQRKKRTNNRRKNGGTLYILNSPIMTSYGMYSLRPIDRSMAIQILASYNFKFISAVGHKETAQFLSKLLGIHVPENRRKISMRTGDVAIVLRLKERLEEGVVLTEEEILRTPHELALLIKH